MSFDEALSYLLSLGHETLTIKLGLRNTETLLAALGDPHKSFPSVQIAGTNGKGSTAVTLDSICRAAGIRTGLFTSPHLISITERIKINGAEISESDFATLTWQVKTTAEELIKQGRLDTLPTFFEQVTAISLLAFREAKVELAILETGMGGRLDSTTAARADIVAITSVAMDHQEYLGDTLSEIAAEKAAIIRPDVIAVVAPQNEVVRELIVRQCERAGLTPRFTTRELPDSYQNISVGLRGRHQIINASTAIALAEALRERGFAITRAAIVRGVEAATHAGRLELWQSEPEFLFDGAHNPAAAQALRDYLDDFITQPITMIFAAMKDKALAEMAATLFPKADELILTKLDNPRAATVEMLMSAVPAGFDKARVRPASSAQVAVQIARTVTPADGLVCVTGSLFLVGAIQETLREGRARTPRS
ncbi:MAG: dihydrofolate synthase / folylpolyglutamate synthase [Blastocatellia bacterium]|jgi:dihydrofolate synthase/folylpolyglutamate synthase|nr:dihydrofolate synthase / folylpolyglutamate synthase [Blastocatellia bacterium]